MKSLSGIGLGISLVFGCLLLALVIEIYYMLFLKKRFNVFHRNHEETGEADEEDKLSNESSSTREFLYMFCCKKMSFLCNCGALNPHQICASVRTQQQLNISKVNMDVKSEDGILCQIGPPRYLFTIIEETMEDLVSDDDDDNGSGIKKHVKRRKGSTSLNELLLLNVDENETNTNPTTPYLTPVSSPAFMINQTPHHVFNFNPFLESSSDVEISKIKVSPPPKFRFLQDAEEKFQRRKMMEDEEQGTNKGSVFTQDSFITIVVGDHSSDKAQ